MQDIIDKSVGGIISVSRSPSYHSGDDMKENRKSTVIEEPDPIR
jgi:hypothetical protein